jgi:hypothetical protein
MRKIMPYTTLVVRRALKYGKPDISCEQLRHFLVSQKRRPSQLIDEALTLAGLIECSAAYGPVTAPRFYSAKPGRQFALARSSVWFGYGE